MSRETHDLRALLRKFNTGMAVKQIRKDRREAVKVIEDAIDVEEIRRMAQRLARIVRKAEAETGRKIRISLSADPHNPWEGARAVDFAIGEWIENVKHPRVHVGGRVG